MWKIELLYSSVYSAKAFQICLPSVVMITIENFICETLLSINVE